MKLQSQIFRNSLFLLAAILALPAFRAAAQSKPVAAQAQANQSNSQPGLKPLPRNSDGDLVEEGPEFLRGRQDWFFKPRAFPLGFIPQGARERALQEKKQMYQREGRFNLLAAPGGAGFAAPPAGTSSAWFSIGPSATNSAQFGPFISGRVTAITVNPNNKDNAYLGGADGGLWITIDGGSTWTALAATENPPNSGIPTIAVGSLAIDPTTCNATICTTVYVGTGEGNFGGENIYGEGVLKCAVTAGTPPTAVCTQDSTFHFTSGAPLDQSRGGPMIGALAVNPRTGSNNILLAGVRGRATAIQSGIYCSADSGATWTPVFGISGIVGTDVAFASDGTAFVALGFPSGDATNNGIYKSKVAITSCTSVTDPSGTAPSSSPNWTKQVLPAGTPASSLGRITLAIFPSATSTGANATVYAAIADSTTTSSKLLGLIKTSNGGTTWTQPAGDPRITSTSGVCNSQCFYDIPLAVSPASANDVLFGGAARSNNVTHTLIRSLDGGATWTEISRNDVNGATDSIHVDMHAIAFSKDGSRMYVGNDGGAWRTDNPLGAPNAGFWTNLNQSLNITQFYPGVSIHPANAGFSLGGTQDNDVQIYQGSNGTPLAWNTAQIGCDGAFTAIDFNIPSTSYGECEYLPNHPPFPLILVTFNGDGILGNGFLANSGINTADRGSFIPPLVMDPNTPTTLYFGTCRVWASKDGANTWNAISPDVTAATHPAGCGGTTGGNLSTIAAAAAPGNSKTIYVGSDNGEIEVTSDTGATWTRIVTATLPARAVTQIVVDPSNPAIAYAAFSGFGTCATFCSGPTGHVFKTVNGTAGVATTWVDISGTTTKLPDIPVNAIVIDPNDAAHNTLYIGTDIGAFFTLDGGLNWSPLGAASSLPNAQILSLTLHNASRTLRAATHGRGVWDLNLGGAGAFSITSISPFSASAGAPSIPNFTVNGNGFTASSVVNFTAGGVTTPLTTSCATATTCTTTIPTAQLLNGALAQITVTDTGKTSNAMPFTVLNPVPGITSISPTTATAGSGGLTLTVNGSNFLTGATLVLFNTIPLPANAVTVTNSTTLTVQVPAANLATAQKVSVDTFNPQPGGGPDTNPTPPTLTITGSSGTFSVNGTAVTVTAGSSNTSTITLTPSGGFTGNVDVTCPATGLPAGVACSPNPLPINVTGTAAVTGQLTLAVAAPSTTLTASAAPAQAQRTLYAAGTIPPRGGKGWWTLSAGTGLAALFLLFLPGRKRYRAALGLGLVCLLSFTLGCSSGYGGGGGGLATTTTKLTASTGKVAAGQSDTFTITVTSSGTAANGQVQLYDGTSTMGAPVSVVSGTATINGSGLTAGTHSISAHYLGDTYTQASQSGALNITFQGTTTFTIMATPAASNGNQPVNITIN